MSRVTRIAEVLLDDSRFDWRSKPDLRKRVLLVIETAARVDEIGRDSPPLGLLLDRTYPPRQSKC